MTSTCSGPDFTPRPGPAGADVAGPHRGAPPRVTTADIGVPKERRGPRGRQALRFGPGYRARTPDLAPAATIR